MSMLSRVAERLYWMARYLERAGDTARLVQAYNHLVMDIPSGTEMGWEVLVRILDAQPDYEKRFRVYNEQNVLRFLIADLGNAASIAHSLRSARENVRTTRDVLPAEAWEHVNELHLYCQEFAEKSCGRRNRNAFLDEIINRCNMIDGMMLTNLCRDRAYSFIKLGALLERADMTTRVIDVGAEVLLGDERKQTSVDPLIWASLLRSLSAIAAYRRYVGPMVEAQPVVEFVLREQSLPRSVKFCLDGVRSELQRLNRHEAPLKLADRSRRKLVRLSAKQMDDRQQLHRFIDELQVQLNQLHEAISRTWFMPES
jgi:uncharacterized alpha-E superfamily protein